jgi:hypothetical protein
MSDVAAQVCRKLRTKQAFGSPPPELLDWREAASTTDVYWCLETMETFGPDDGYAHPDRCRSGRSCCKCEGSEPVA